MISHEVEAVARALCSDQFDPAKHGPEARAYVEKEWRRFARAARLAIRAYDRVHQVPELESELVPAAARRRNPR